MLLRIIFCTVLLISLILAYQQFSHKATVNTMAEAHPDFIMGTETAPNTVIMFFDYNSRWSRRTHPVLLQLISQYPDTKVVLRDYPGITRRSEDISRIALAARTKGKYREIHNAIMSMEGDLTEERLAEMVSQLGMNYDELKEIGQSPEISRQLDENRQAAFFLGIQAAPSFVVNGELVSGGGFTVSDFRKIITRTNRR